MDIKDIKEIVEFMKESELAELEIEKDGYKVRLHRNVGTPMMATPVGAPLTQTTSMSTAPSQKVEDPSLSVYKSPMVGTFYRAPSPESPSFVEKGTRVSDETVVGIIEAMKVMNEIQAEMSGEIVEILVQNGQTVEFGQPLFKIKQA